MLRALASRWAWERRLGDALVLVQLVQIVPGLRGRMRLTLAWSALAVKSWLGVWPRLQVRIRWAGERGGTLSAVVGDLSEVRVIHEVFVLREYELAEASSARTIVDAGSNVGISVMFFKDRYPDARVIGVEPHPETFERLRRNTAHLAGVEIVHAALTDEEGTVPLFAGTESWAASLAPAGDRHDQVVVPATTLDRVVADHELAEIDILKLDIEGAEGRVLESSAVRERVKLVVFEFHQEHSDESLWTLLERLDVFRLVRCRGDSNVHPLVTLLRR